MNQPPSIDQQADNNGTHFPNSLILNQLMNQSSNSSRTQHQGGGISMSSLLGGGGSGGGGGMPYVPGHRSTTTAATTNNNLLAAALQQQVMASLAAASSSPSPTSTNFPSMLHHHHHHHSMGGLKGFPTNPTGLPPLLSSSSSFGRQTSIDSQRQQARDHVFNSTSGIRSNPKKESSYRSDIATTQIPCQARGMSAGHNAITAYFEIPSNAIHGQHLYCSHAACRAAGVKFRYCLHCKKPVTKQNFRSRHLHAGADNKKPMSVAAGIKKLQEQKKKKKQESKASSSHTQNQRPPPSSNSSSMTPSIPMTENGKVDATKKRKEFPSLSSPLPTSGIDPALNVVARRRRWSSLLRERPIELSSMNGWLSKVITVSAPNIHISLTEESLLLTPGTPGGTPSIEQQAAWDELLTQRPDNVSTSAPTEWLVKVLTTSCPGRADGDNNNVTAKSLTAGGAAMAGELGTKNVELLPPNDICKPVVADTAATASKKRAKTSGNVDEEDFSS